MENKEKKKTDKVFTIVGSGTQKHSFRLYDHCFYVFVVIMIMVYIFIECEP